MRVIPDVDGLKAAIRAQSFEGGTVPEEQQTVSMAGVLAIIDAHTVEADLVRREDAVTVASKSSHVGCRVVCVPIMEKLPAWDGKGDEGCLNNQSGKV